VKEQREAWAREVLARAAGLAPGGLPGRLVFVDETGCNTAMARTHGRAAPGARVPGAVPYGHWHTTTVIGAVRLGGVAAAITTTGGTTGDVFKAFLEFALVPALKPGDVVAMDNLSAHHVAGVRERIEAAGAALLHLPPYSPDLNPIEKMWSKVKQSLRNAAARTKEALEEAIAQALAAVTEADCIGWFRSCGYAIN